MGKLPFKRLIGPAIVFLIFVLIGIRTEDLLQQFGLAALTQTRLVLSYGVKVGFWFSAAFFLNRVIAVVFWDGIVSRAVKGQVPRLLKDLTAFLIYAIAGTGVMAFVFQKPVTGFWATSGVAGIVLGIALRNIILDVFTGLAVNLDRPYTIGDWIMIVDNPGDKDGNLIGCVEEINWRTTRLRTASNNMLVVPNNIMGQKVVTNFMAPGEESRFELEFTLDFSVPSERAIRVLTAAVMAVADSPEGPLSDPAPKARVTGISDMGVRYSLRYWTIPRQASPVRVRHTVITSVLQHLHQAGMTLAYPKQDTFNALMPKRQFLPEAPEDRHELLGRVSWFAALTTEEVSGLAKALVPRRFAQGTVLLCEGDQGDSMFVLLEGFLEVFARSAQSGEDVKVGKLVPGDVYGEISLLTGEPRTATVRAATEAVAYEIRKEHLEPVLKARPAAADAITRIVAERRVATERALAEVAMPVPEERVESLAQTLLKKMKSFFAGVLGDAKHLHAVPLQEHLGRSA
jgi:small-conductance mechanosensitive channel/CRP-like cAMP-binding protein